MPAGLPNGITNSMEHQHMGLLCKAALCREQMMLVGLMMVLVWIGVNSCTINQGSSALMPPYIITFSKPLIVCQKCDNHLLVVAPGTLGMIPAASLGLVSKDGERACKKCHGGLLTEQRGTTN